MQDCSEGLHNINYSLKIVEDWEHLLVGEPLEFRETVRTSELEEDDGYGKVYEEKHLDMPSSWCSIIDIPHEGKYLFSYFAMILDESHN